MNKYKAARVHMHMYDLIMQVETKLFMWLPTYSKLREDYSLNPFSTLNKKIKTYTPDEEQDYVYT